MKTTVAPCWTCFFLMLLAAAQGGQPDFDLQPVFEAARKVPALYLTAEQKESVARTFLKLVSLRSPSGQEGAVREELRTRLAALGAADMLSTTGSVETPRNLVMVLSASPQDRDQPGLLLNAHLDTIQSSNPEQLRFEAETGDFYHADERDRSRGSSFGADDKAGLAVIVGCLTALQERYWTSNAPHRRIVVALTAEEETGCVGARHLATAHPEVFKDLDLALTFDGPIDYHSEYPAVSFVAVVSEPDAQREPYRTVLALLGQVAEKKLTRFAQTELGLGMGDFAQFPPAAHAGLHLRSPQRGFHRQERVKLSDLLHHADLLCHLLLHWDEARSR